MMVMEGHRAPPPRQCGAEQNPDFADLLNRIIEIQLLQVELQREHIAVSRQSELCRNKYVNAEEVGDESDFQHLSKRGVSQVATTQCPKPPLVELPSEDAPCPPKEAASLRGTAEKKFADHVSRSDGTDSGIASRSGGTFILPGHSQPSIDTFQSAPVELRGEHVDLPESVPTRVRCYLAFVGLLPVGCFATWHRWLYGCYICAILLCFLLISLSYALQFFLRISLGIGGFPEEIFGFVALASVTFVWGVFGRALRPGGATLTLMHDMDRRGFRWHAASASVRRFTVATLCWLMIAPGATSVGLTSETHMCHKVADHGELMAQIVCMMSSTGTVPFTLFSQALLLGIVWCLHLFCCLHRHELMWYAYALTSILAKDDGNTDAMQSLYQVEVLVTRRLRHASETWVRAAVICLASLGAVGVFLVTRLLSAPDMNGSEFMANFVFLILTIVICALWGLPLAQVAEVFDNDVLRTLNNPLVLKAAQRHFGQQLLSHLHTLEWGFRVGQTVINMKMVVNLCTAIVVTTVTALSQSVLNQLPSQ